jgi:energy-converting hydrogenase Eha subunit E
MIERRWEQITALAGIASVALLIGQLATWANPHFNDPVTKIIDYYVKNRGMALASIDLWMLGMIALLVLAAGLRSIVRRTEGDSDVLSTIAFGGAVAMLCLGTAFNAMNGALALFAGQASPSEIRLLMVLTNAARLMGPGRHDRRAGSSADRRRQSPVSPGAAGAVAQCAGD